MSREIKFRGQRIDNKEWVYGYYIKDPKGQHRIYWKPFDEASSNTYHFIKAETIGQFTGLHDKNGKEIYEGDILSKMWKVEVYKDEKTNAFMVKFHTHPEINKPRTLYQYLKDRKRANTEDTDCVIIGNIYENTEILRGGEK